MGTWVDNPKEGSVGTISWNLVNGRFDMSQEFAQNAYDMTYQYVDDMSA